MSQGAANYPITIEQGATFNRVLTLTDSDGNLINLTGYSARMTIRRANDFETVLIELTTVNARIALGGAAGTVTLSISDSDTAALEAEVGVYDLEIESAGGTVTRLIQGTATIDREVTV